MPLFRLAADSVLFPPVELAEPDGLLAIGGDLSAGRLLAAYRQGIFPWYGENSPILWWSPNPRCVLFPERLHLPASLRRVMNSGRFSFTVNRSFRAVMEGCARTPRPGQDGTWIVPEMSEAYSELHRRGRAHSVETWQEGELAGGLYGISLGRVFFGESMFYRRPDASKAALAWLVQNLARLGFEIMDCQQETDHMLRFGAELVDRSEFLRIIKRSEQVECAAGEAIDAFWRGRPPDDF
ncbi:MAG: leucyl/phenylalanyl-tRNA--protein transferase [Deltaproteobacteria bacterium]|jgi:leucyl/phenylalanyl-tRNA--protein transferase|nr:leucyl/phenylalanyl-tRNA--protein transferase [Deltaproteobacteria bacterium]